MNNIIDFTLIKILDLISKEPLNSPLIQNYNIILNRYNKNKAEIVWRDGLPLISLKIHPALLFSLDQIDDLLKIEEEMTPQPKIKVLSRT